LILFGPETPFTAGDAPAGSALPAYDDVTPADLWDQFTEWSKAAGTPDILDASAFNEWAATYLRSDPTSGSRTPPSVRIPNGRQADTSAIVGGKFPYDPGAIRAATLIVMGEFDAIATSAGAQWLLQSPARPRNDAWWSSVAAAIPFNMRRSAPVVPRHVRLSARAGLGHASLKALKAYELE
jgi:hypothetical protein